MPSDPRTPEYAPLDLTRGEASYVLALVQRERKRWVQRLDHATSHGAILRREGAADAIEIIDVIVEKLSAIVTVEVPTDA